MIPQHTYLWFDLRFTAILTVSDWEVCFEVYRHMGRTGDGCGPPVYECDGDMNCRTPYLDDAALFCEGTITFEGCINWRAGTPERMAHLCNLKQIVTMGQMLHRLHKSAFALMSSAKG